MFALLFLGAYHLPGLELTSPENTTIFGVIAKIVVFLTKAVGLVCFCIVIRWTIPRLRYDQIMHSAWQGMIPLSLGMVVVASVLTYLGRTDTFTTLASNCLLTAVFLVALSMTRPKVPNSKIRLAGSRFSPLVGEVVQSRPTHVMAIADKPL
jgi:NADH-quinone oxidoreductase subunit H